MIINLYIEVVFLKATDNDFAILDRQIQSVCVNLRFFFFNWRGNISLLFFFDGGIEALHLVVELYLLFILLCWLIVGHCRRFCSLLRAHTQRRLHGASKSHVFFSLLFARTIVDKVFQISNNYL